jgi:hypothetical protein
MLAMEKGTCRPVASDATTTADAGRDRRLRAALGYSGFRVVRPVTPAACHTGGRGSSPSLPYETRPQTAARRAAVLNVRGTQRRQPVVNAGQARTGRAAQRATNGDWRERAAKHGAGLSRWRSRLRVPSLLFQSLLEGGFRLVTSTRGAATQRLRAGPWDCESPAATRKVQPAARLPGHRRAPELATNSGRSGLCVATCAQGPDSASTEGQPQSQPHT